MSIQAGLKERAYSIAEMARTPDQIKAAQRTLSQAVQDGSLPSYVGIPLISELNQKMAKASVPVAAAPMQQPPIAQQVMQQAQADQGVATLPSNLPQEEMAGGGIVAFASGGSADRQMIEALLGREEDESDEDYDEMVSALAGAGHMPDISRILKMVEDSNLPSDEGIESLSPVASKTFLTRTPEGAAVENVTRREGDGAVQVERDKKAISAEDDALLKYVLAKESGGRRYDRSGNLLTSPKGAQGEMQVMPGTQLDPGFGVEPARDRSPDEIARVGRDYLKAMRQRYGDDKLAAIAYNMGPGATDKWLASGADPRALPAETRQYIAGMAGGGAVHFQTGGISDIFNMSADEIKDLARRKLRIDQARAAFSAMPETAPSAAAPAATGPSYQSLSSPSYGQRLMNFLKPAGIAGPGAAVGAGGAGLSALSANYLNRLPDESLQYLGGAMDDTGLAANILLQGRQDESKGITGVKPTAAAPTAAAPAAAPPKKSVITLPPTGAGAGKGGQGGISFADLDRQVKEEELSKTLEAADLEEGRAMERMAKEGAEAKKEEAKEEPKSKLEQLLEGRLGRLDKQREEDKYLALLAAGLGIAGGTSPYALTNIGQGGQAGVSSLLRSAATRTAEENAIMQGQLGLERYKGLADIRKQGIASQKALKEMELGIREKIAEGQQANKADALALRQKNMDLQRLSQIEKLAQNQALAEFKGTLLPEQKEQILAKALNDLRMDPGYRDFYKRVHGFDPGAQIRSYDPATGKLR